jgi:hypothetical protein
LLFRYKHVLLFQYCASLDKHIALCPVFLLQQFTLGFKLNGTWFMWWDSRNAIDIWLQYVYIFAHTHTHTHTHTCILIFEHKLASTVNLQILNNICIVYLYCIAAVSHIHISYTFLGRYTLCFHACFLLFLVMPGDGSDLKHI